MPVRLRASVSERGRRRPYRLLTPIGALLAALLAAPVPTASAASGTLSLTPGASDEVVLGGNLTDGGMRTAFVVPSRPGGAVFAGMSLRGGAGAGYRAKVRMAEDGTWSQSLVRVRGSHETPLVAEPAAGRLATGDRVIIQLSVSGSRPVTVRMRSWIAGGNKPGWQLSHADSSTARITEGGAPRLWGYLSSGASAPTKLQYSSTATWGSTSSEDRVQQPADDPVAQPSSSTGGKPTRDNTGVPAGVDLQVHHGDLKITEPGTVVDRLDVRGFITVKAPNVTIRRSIVRGGKATYNRGVITNYGYDNLLIEDVDILPSSPTVYQDGVKGWDFTMNRVYVRGNVDSVKVHGDGNVVIRSSLLENTTYFSSDPNQGGKATHNDGVQVLYGRDIKIIGNTIRGQQNFAVLGAANSRNTSGLVVKDNWLDGGHCTVKLEEKRGYHLSVSITENKFGPNRKVSNCKINAIRGTAVTASGNVLEADGDAVGVLWTDA